MAGTSQTLRLSRGVFLGRTPTTDLELWLALQALWGVTVPRTRVCPDHTPPFMAFADAFFARSPVTVWKASRGFGGKSWTLACLSLTEAALLGAGVNVLGGSASQSLNVHEHTQLMWDHPGAPDYLLADDPTKYVTKLTNYGRIKALMASQRSVRGPHPQRLRLDEIDEMELNILNSAMGMPMTGRGIRGQTVMSSTHQYPDGTMTAILHRAREKNWPVSNWCYRECSNPIDGWLSQEQIDQKRTEVSNQMFHVEYDLQAPSIEGRAVDSAAVVAAYDKTIGVFEGANSQEYVFQEPEEGVMYATGADWARKKDYTIIDTFRTDTWERVAWLRINKRPWPEMIGMAIRRLRKYPGYIAHDATGLGDVIAGLFPNDFRLQQAIVDIVLVGNLRSAIFSEWITAMEQGAFKSPYIEFAYDEALYCTVDDLFRSGSAKNHPPDSVVAHALAWHLRQYKTYSVPVPVDDFAKPASGWTIPSAIGPHGEWNSDFEIRLG